jgi:uncharacterized protein (TIGR03067 family)
MTVTLPWFLTGAIALAAPAPQKKDEDLLQGQWQAISVEHNGKKAPAKEIAHWNLMVARDKMTARDGEMLLDESTFHLDPAATPRSIDLMLTDGPDKGKAVLGIYQVQADKLTICVAEPGKERPKQFHAPEGRDLTLIVFQRPKP